MTAFYTAQKSLCEENTPQNRIRQLAEEHSLCSVRTKFLKFVLTALEPQILWTRIEVIEDTLSDIGHITFHDAWAEAFWDGLTKNEYFGGRDTAQFTLAYAKAFATIINTRQPAKTLKWLWSNRAHELATRHDRIAGADVPVLVPDYNACQVLMDLYSSCVFKHEDIWRLFVDVNPHVDPQQYEVNNRIYDIVQVDKLSEVDSEPVLFSVLNGVWKHAVSQKQGYSFKHEKFLSWLDGIVEELAAYIQQRVTFDHTENVSPYARWPAFKAQLRFDALRQCSLKPQHTADEYFIEAIMLDELSEARINDLINSSLERLFARYQQMLKYSRHTYRLNVLDYEPCAVFYFTEHRDAWLNRFLEFTYDDEFDMKFRVSALGSRLPTAFPSCDGYPSELMARMQNQSSFGTVRVNKVYLPLETMKANRVMGGLYGEDPFCEWISDFPESHREKWQNAFFDLEKTLSRDNSDYVYWVNTLASNSLIDGPELIPYLEKTLAGMVRRFDVDDSFNSISGYREIITKLGDQDPVKLLNQLLRAYRAAPVPNGCDPTVVVWDTESIYAEDPLTQRTPMDALAYLIAREVPKFFKADRRLEKNEDEDALRLDTELGKICLSRLKVTTRGQSVKSYSNDDCNEADWAFRCSYLKAIEELHMNPGGRAHKYLHFMREGDPNEHVRQVARASYKAVRQAKPHSDERSQHRAYLAAFWWIRIGKAESEGIDIDMTRAKRQRRRELRFIN